MVLLVSWNVRRRSPYWTFREEVQSGDLGSCFAFIPAGTSHGVVIQPDHSERWIPIPDRCHHSRGDGNLAEVVVAVNDQKWRRFLSSTRISDGPVYNWSRTGRWERYHHSWSGVCEKVQNAVSRVLHQYPRNWSYQAGKVLWRPDSSCRQDNGEA